MQRCRGRGLSLRRWGDVSCTKGRIGAAAMEAAWTADVAVTCAAVDRYSMFWRQRRRRPSRCDTRRYGGRVGAPGKASREDRRSKAHRACALKTAARTAVPALRGPRRQDGIEDLLHERRLRLVLPLVHDGLSGCPYTLHKLWQGCRRPFTTHRVSRGPRVG